MRYLFLFSIVLFFLSCQENKPSLNVGDIVFDENIDDRNFELCNEKLIKQYYVRYSSDKPSGYIGEKAAIVDAFNKKYSCPIKEGEDGFLTIRFVVNCHGKPGRFRMQEMDFNYMPRKFDNFIREQLLEITKGLDKWIPVSRDEKLYDFYQYLTFRLEDGQIKKIMP